MKKIFLDCGSHQGEGFEHFNKIKEYMQTNNFDFHLWD